MDFKTELIADVRTKEETLDVCHRGPYFAKLMRIPQNFFTNVRARIAQAGVRGPSADGRHHFDEPEKTLTDTCDSFLLATRVLTASVRLHDAQRGFRAALCDSFNTPVALNVLLDLVSQNNIYFARSKEYNVGVIETIAAWVTRALKMFGLGEGIAAGASEGIGWGTAGEGVEESGDVGGSSRLTLLY